MEIVINKFINQFTKGVCRYTHGDSTWLIFSESKQWVIELTGSKTLWYNYNFFQEIFHYASLDVVQNQHLITKWVEDNVVNETKRTNGRGRVFNRRKAVESVIENGVKEIRKAYMKTDWSIDDTIENGVKVTSSLQSREYTGDIDEALQKGVEETNWANHADPDRIDEVIEGGIKETKQKNNSFVILDTNGRELILESHLVIRDGVKETSHRRFLKTYDVKDTIQDGTENDYWVLDGCDTPVDEVIDNGIEEIYEVDWDVPNDVIDEVIDTGITSTHDDIYHHRGRVDGVIKNGVKETTALDPSYSVKFIEEILENGIKETKPMDDWVNTVRIVTEVIDEGIKKPTD